jgi:UDP-3-O-[3-hydroxymyristoyl] N-acetylglucosamine deacetylase
MLSSCKNPLDGADLAGSDAFSWIRSPWLQATLASPFQVSGIGLHSGQLTHVTIRPAAIGTGRIIRRTTDGIAHDIPALWTHRVQQYMCTGIQHEAGALVRTIEHLMASLAVFGIDNALIEIDGEELPIFDGSAVPWCHAILKAGVQQQDAPRTHLRIIVPVEIREPSGAWLRIEPATTFSISVTSDPPGFGLLTWDGEPTPWTFLCDIAPSRSHGPILNFPSKLFFGATRQPKLRGASFATVGLTFRGRYINGMRVADEPVRHRVLDLIGDLALAGAPLIGRVTGHRPRHDLNNMLVRAIMQRPEAWEGVTLEPEMRTGAQSARP